MNKETGISPLRHQNNIKIKRYIYKYAPITVEDLAKNLALQNSTVTTTVTNMLQKGLLVEIQSQEQHSFNLFRGRPPVSVEYNAHAGFAVGVEIGSNRTIVCTVDLLRGIYSQQSYQAAPMNYDEMCYTICGYIKKSLGTISNEDIIGVGIGISGVIDSENGVIRSSSREQWEGKNFAQDINSSLGLSVLIDNNVRMRAHGEELVNRLWNEDLIAYYYLSNGIACPLLLKDDAVLGYSAGVGEIGHNIINPAGPVCSNCHNRGCLESLTGEATIINNCLKAIEIGKSPVLAEILSRNNYQISIGAILQAQSKGDAGVDAILRKTVEYMAISLAGLANVISPHAVAIDGAIMTNSENRERFIEYCSKYLYGLSTKEIRFEFLTYDGYRGAKSSAACVIKKFMIET